MIYTETHNEKENIQEEELTQEQADVQEETENHTNNEENTIADSKNKDDNSPEDEAISEDDKNIESEESSNDNQSDSKEDGIKNIMDYLSSEILEIREVKEEELVDTNVEEKFVLNEELVVNVRKNNIVHGNVVNVSDRDVFIDIGFKKSNLDVIIQSYFSNSLIVDGKSVDAICDGI